MQSATLRMFGWVGLCWLVVGTAGHANLPRSPEEQQKQMQLRLQLKCLQRCESQGFRSFFRCGPDGSRYQKASADIYFRDCVQRCNVGWFCGGYRQAVRHRCPAMCLQQHQNKRPKKTWRRYPTRKQYLQWLRRYQRWELLTRFACRRVCANYNMICNIHETVVLPPKARLPKFESLP